jgi:hypothetical protein
LILTDWFDEAHKQGSMCDWLDHDNQQDEADKWLLEDEDQHDEAAKTSSKRPLAQKLA